MKSLNEIKTSRFLFREFAFWNHCRDVSAWRVHCAEALPDNKGARSLCFSASTHLIRALPFVCDPLCEDVHADGWVANPRLIHAPSIDDAFALHREAAHLLKRARKLAPEAYLPEIPQIPATGDFKADVLLDEGQEAEYRRFVGSAIRTASWEYMGLLVTTPPELKPFSDPLSSAFEFLAAAHNASTEASVLDAAWQGVMNEMMPFADQARRMDMNDALLPPLHNHIRQSVQVGDNRAKVQPIFGHAADFAVRAAFSRAHWRMLTTTTKLESVPVLDALTFALSARLNGVLSRVAWVVALQAAAASEEQAEAIFEESNQFFSLLEMRTPTLGLESRVYSLTCRWLPLLYTTPKKPLPPLREALKLPTTTTN